MVVSPVGRHYLTDCAISDFSRHNPPEKSFVKSLGMIRPCLFSIELGCSDHHKPSKVRDTVSVRVSHQDIITKSVSSLRLMGNFPIRKILFSACLYLCRLCHQKNIKTLFWRRMRHARLELATPWLKVKCSPIWANGANISEVYHLS